MSLIKYPYTNLHELNLDWLIEQLNNPDGPVRSVNGKAGIVTLTGEDIVRSSSNPETVAAALQTQGTSIQTVRNQIGVTALPTVAQTLTGAIAENAQTIADVEDNVIGSTALPTTAQTLTGAIAENANTISNVEDNVIGNTVLPTTAQTLTGAIAENANTISNVEDNVIGNTALPTTAQTLTGAIAELNTTKAKNLCFRASEAVFTAASVGTQTETITFATPFQNTPVVMATWKDTATVIAHMSFLTITSVSPTGFTIAVDRKNASAGWRFAWFAFSPNG